MDYLICPVCQEMPLMKKENHRVCDNCGHSMDEIAYHVYAAETQVKFNNDYDAAERKSMRSVRKSFGSKKPVAKAA